MEGYDTPMGLFLQNQFSGKYPAVCEKQPHGVIRLFIKHF
jgi:hypothetical protein